MANYSRVAAIEFGPKYSRYAFALKSDPPNITTNELWDYSRNILSKRRTSTCIMLNEKEECEAIGYEAEEKYAEHNQKCFFFMQFQSALTDKEKIAKDAKLKDVRGKTVSTEKVFSMFIGAMKNKLVEKMNIGQNDIYFVRWIITVPVDLTKESEDFMKTCAEQAGIARDHLMLVTEAETAFAYSHTCLQKDVFSDLHDSTEYMTVALNGCTAYIRVVKTVSHLLIEKYKESFKYNESALACTEFLMKYFPDSKSKLITRPLDYLDIERGLEEATCVHQLDDIAPVTKAQDIALKSLCKAFGIDLKQYTKDGNICFESAKTYNKVCAPIIQQFVSKMEQIFKNYKEYKNVRYIVMTGDFYECCLFEHALSQKFLQKRILSSTEDEDAVVKGAVLFGQNPYQLTLECLKTYPKLQSQKGLLLVINFRFSGTSNERKGSEEDVVELKEFFTKLNYEVLCWTDENGLKADDLKKGLEDVARTYLTKNSNDYHSFICVIMSHGNMGGIETSAEGNITVDELVQPFKNDKAVNFIEKPKIFMIQTCRGDLEQTKIGQPKKAAHTDYTFAPRMPKDADILIIYATIKEYASFRGYTSTKWKGAWLIHAFICVAKQYPENHILDILTAVNYELAKNPEYEIEGGICQLSTSEVSLSKLFYLKQT